MSGQNNDVTTRRAFVAVLCRFLRLVPQLEDFDDHVQVF